MATSKGKSKKRTQKEADKDLSKTYNQFKEFEGHKYTGMKIGRSHKWYYDYTTALTGLKYKLAHKRADTGKWNVSDKTQRKRLIKMLKDMIGQLEKAPENLNQPPDTKMVPPPKKTIAKPAATGTTRRKQTAATKKKTPKAV